MVKFKMHVRKGLILILTICLLLSVSSFNNIIVSASGEYLPDTSRLPGGTLWQRADVGVEGGIPDSSAMTVYTTLQSSSTASQINNAIANCPSGQVVVLGAGTFSLNGKIIMKSGVVLKGQGPDSTILNFNVNNHGINGIDGYIRFMGISYEDPKSTVKNWIGGLAQGSTVLTLSNVSGLNVGDLVGIDQLDDSSIGVVRGDFNTSRSPGNRNEVQYVRITAIDSGANTVTISHPVLMANFSPSLTPQLFKVNSGDSQPIELSGAEDLKIVDINQADPNDNIDYNIYMQGAWNCWLKNITSIKPERAHLRTYECGRIEVRHSFFNQTVNYATESYGMNIGSTSFCLIEDNIFDEVSSPFVIWGGTSGSVFAYNYTHYMRFDQSPTWLSEDACTHGAHPSMNLFEGNVLTSLYWDFIHGSASHNSAFRNIATGWEEGKLYNTFPVVAERNNRYETYAGNVLGTAGYHTRYKLSGTVQTGNDDYIYVMGYAGTNQGDLTNYDPAVASTAILKGNYNYADNGVNAAESLGSDTLRASWYMDSKPAWFGDVAWPAVGPDVPGLTNKIPAQLRFESGGDPTPTPTSTPTPTPTATPTPTPTQTPGSALPDGWNNTDVGSCTPAGSSSYTDGTFTINGSGEDIWDTADAFQFAYKQVTGDCSIIARVNSVTYTSSWAKAGVMIRETTAANSKHALMAMKPVGLTYQWRSTTGGNCSSSLNNTVTLPRYVKLTREGNAFKAYYSSDGTAWTQQGTTQNIAMNAALYVGLAVSSVNNGVLCTGVFDDVTIIENGPTPTPTPTPTPAAIIGFNGEGTMADIISDASGNYLSLARFQAPSAMTVSKIYAKLEATTGRFRFAIYNDSSGNVGSLKAQTGEVVNPASDGWYYANLTTSQSLTSGAWYWLAVWSNAGSNEARVFCNSSGGTVKWTSPMVYGNYPSSLTTVGGHTCKYCIYAQ